MEKPRLSESNLTVFNSWAHVEYNDHNDSRFSEELRSTNDNTIQ